MPRILAEIYPITVTTADGKTLTDFRREKREACRRAAKLAIAQGEGATYSVRAGEGKSAGLVEQGKVVPNKSGGLRISNQEL